MESGQNGYLIDMRGRQELLWQMELLAQSYTPEWKFDTDHPDAASVIGILFAEQTAESVRKVNQALRRYHIEFANMYGVSLRPAHPAGTVCTMKAGGNVQPGVFLGKGTQVTGENTNGDTVIFTFQNDTYVTNAQLAEILGMSGSAGKAVAYQGRFAVVNPADGQISSVFPEGYAAGEIPMFSCQGDTIHRQALVLYFAGMPDMQGDCIQLRFCGEMPAEALAGLFADTGRFSFSFLSGEGLIPIKNVRKDGDIVCLERQGAMPAKAADKEELSAIVLEMKEPVGETVRLDRIEWLVHGHEGPPDFMWNGNSELVGNRFPPFSQQPSLYDTLYIGQGFCLAQRGACVSLQFGLEFETYTPQDTAVYEPDLRLIKKKPKNGYRAPRYECRIQEVSFEYFNGKGWKRLAAKPDISALFSREENAGKYTVRFETPPDWEPVVQGGYEGNCIRMQVLRADNCYMQEVTYFYPVLSDMKFRMENPERGVVPVRAECIQNSRIEDVSREIFMGRMISPFTPLPYQGEYLFLGFDRVLGPGPVALFLELDKLHFYEEIPLKFACSCKNGFQPLKVVDGTDGLQKPGILMFMPPEDMAAYEVEGVEAYWIRMEAAGCCFAGDRRFTPVLKRIIVNAVKAENIVTGKREDYYIDSTAANMRFPLYAQNILSADVWVNEWGQFSREEMRHILEQGEMQVQAEYDVLGEISEFYVLWQEVEDFAEADQDARCYCIDRGTNELIFGDGVHVRVPRSTDGAAFWVRVRYCDGESANVKAYTLDTFRHPVLSVEEVTNPIDAYSGSDMEDMDHALGRAGTIFLTRKRLVSEADYVREALSFSDGIAKASCVLEGSTINLVLLMQDYDQGSYSFQKIKDGLKEHFLQCCELTCGVEDIRIVEPVFVRVCVDLWLTETDIQDVIGIRQWLLSALETYLEPTGKQGGTGWEIGQLPGTEQIQMMLRVLRRNIRITRYHASASYTDGQKQYETGLDSVAKTPFMICCSGAHHIYIGEK